ncbi:FxLD family lanthipeptide [Streptomyces sp. NPDC020917]|uniref:FxLD family lanthipeptide n=1 Tax=Streptomyces sp. NPDC020917 TaxID=3365102 RepID=UPI0037A885F1
MSPNITHITSAAPTAALAAPDTFDLDVSLVEVGDTAGLVNLTDDGCGSSCGACVTNAA